MMPLTGTLLRTVSGVHRHQHLRLLPRGSNTCVRAGKPVIVRLLFSGVLVEQPRNRGYFQAHSTSNQRELARKEPREVIVHCSPGWMLLKAYMVLSCVLQVMIGAVRTISLTPFKYVQGVAHFCSCAAYQHPFVCPNAQQL